MAAAATRGTNRLYYLDWLRVFSMGAVFLYHTNRFFNSGDWHVKNGDLSRISSMFENALGAWLMPTLFVLSGAAVFYSLQARSAGEFARERVLRILTPLVTLGIFVLGPIQIYLERLTHGDFAGSFFQFLPRYFEGFYGFGGNFAWMGVHLWYLMLLLPFSLMFLPLFVSRAKGPGASLISRLSARIDKPWALALLFVPLVLASHLADAVGLGFSRQMGSWDVFSYMLFFIYGYLLFANPRILETLRRYVLVSVILAAALTVFWLVIRYTVIATPGSGFFLERELRTFISWMWILTFIAAASRFLTRGSRALGYANEAVLPFYILHQPVILCIGYFVVQWSLPVGVKYGIIGVSSFVAIMAIYEVVVRRVNPLRFLFGMKTVAKRREAAQAVGAAGT